MGIFIVLDVVAVMVYVCLMFSAYMAWNRGDWDLGTNRVYAVIGSICSIYLIVRHPWIFVSCFIAASLVSMLRGYIYIKNIK